MTALLELFAGTKSVGVVAEEMGWDVFSSDIHPDFETDYTADILDFDASRVPFVPDVIWASPPCTYFSVASIGHHWSPDKPTPEYPVPHTPKTKEALLGVRIVETTLGIIEFFEGLNKDLIWYMENPMGKLRKLPVVAGMPRRVSITYCAYGDTRRKPTDIWTNDLLWTPRQMCKNGDPCHVAAPRGSRTPGSTQGHATVDRSRLPEELCREILESADSQVTAKVYCLECGDEMVTGSVGEPTCPECHDFAEEVPCDHPCDALMSRVGVGQVVDGCDGTRWTRDKAFRVSSVCAECGSAMKDYEDGDGYCCPACGTDDGSGAYEGAS